MRPEDKRLLRESSRSAIERSAGLLVAEFSHDHWLPASNQYLKDYPTTVWGPGQSGDGNEVALYMAATVPIHCVDGWTYLGRAIQAQLRGDSGAATHLGYYAELRAAMALLASEGIGIFNEVQLVIDADHQASTLSKHDKAWGTHRSIWPILNDWGKRKEAADLVGEAIQFDAVSLFDWLQSAGRESMLRSVGKELLKLWGLDLSRLSDDHEARNLASYHPTTLQPKEFQPAPNDLSFIRELWMLLEPRMGSPFEELDGNLLRLTLRKAAEAVASGENTQTKTLEKWASDAISKLGIEGSHAEDLAIFLTAPRGEQPSIINYAERHSSPGEPTHHLEVMSRATLLLRLATGSCRRMLRQADITAESLQWWWRKLGTDRGLWNEAPEPDDLIDEWQGIADAIGEIKLDSAEAESRYDLLNEFSKPLSRLAGAEIVPLWSLAA